MKILFVRPPRYRWPFHSEKSSFWQPLGFASMAAVLREGVDGPDIKILDCPAQKIGWKTTKQLMMREKPDVLCVGEETVSSHEALKLVEFTKEQFPHCITIAGGHHFTYLADDTLLNHPVDYIVRFEGEMTLLELIRTLQRNPKPEADQLKDIKGIAFLSHSRVVQTEMRPLLDMEQLPTPAYDLLPMTIYGKGAQSHPNLVAVEHSRGCSCACSFCTLWRQFGRVDPGTGKVVPCYRTKSVKKSIDEVMLLSQKYKRKTFCWVDPTWNLDLKWNSEFSKQMLKTGIDADHSVWMRADYIVRDEQRGIFKQQVRAGIKQVMIGIERTGNDDLRYLNKSGYTYSTTKKAFEIVRRYPSVLSVATYIYGIPGETRESMGRFYDQLGKIPFDVGIPLPLTPNPGTVFFKQLADAKLLEVRDFRYYNFVNPIARTRHLSRNALLLNMLMNELRVRSSKEQFAAHGLKERRKTATRNSARSKTRMAMRYIRGMLQESLLGKPYNYSIRPEWYDE